MRRAGRGRRRNLESEGLQPRRLAPPVARRAQGQDPALLILASAYGQAERLSSAAETRFEIAAAPSAKAQAAAGQDLPGPFACGARLVKSRLARAGPEVLFRLSTRGASSVWNGEARTCF